MGERGCYYRYENGNGYVPAYHVDAVDTNAAGDVLCGGSVDIAD
ncbi:MAG: PfkB family carbohydrate kinase [Christensenellales bacterium]